MHICSLPVGRPRNNQLWNCPECGQIWKHEYNRRYGLDRWKMQGR